MLLVQGLASSVLFDAERPASPVNRRISIIVMNREAEDRLLRASRPRPSSREPPEPRGSRARRPRTSPPPPDNASPRCSTDAREARHEHPPT